MRTANSSAFQVRGFLHHPVIDRDGHWIEFEPLALDYLRELGGPELGRRYQGSASQFFSSRLAPAAVIPMHNPAALAELERSEASRDAVGPQVLGIDREFNSDPVWAKCLELGVSPTFHSGTQGIGSRVSISNFVYNQLGHCDGSDMTEVLPEVRELVDKRLFSEEGLRDFLFSHPVKFWAGDNPNFFKGTVVEDAAEAEITQVDAKLRS